MIKKRFIAYVAVGDSNASAAVGYIEETIVADSKPHK